MKHTLEEYFTIEEVAEKMKVTPITIYRMARKGKIPAIKFGKSWRINAVKLIKQLEKKEKS